MISVEGLAMASKLSVILQECNKSGVAKSQNYKCWVIFNKYKVYDTRDHLKTYQPFCKHTETNYLTYIPIYTLQC